MAYPSRGAWYFYNISRDEQFWPKLDSISITQEQPTGLAVLDAHVVLTGDNAGQVFDVEDHCEVQFRGERIWAGHLKGVTEATADEGAAAGLTISGQDYTAKLDDAIIRRKRKRKRERVRRRVKWLLKQLPSSVWTLTGGMNLSNLPESNPYVEAYDYYGSTVREGLDHVADELRLHYYVGFDNRFQIFRTDTEAAPFDLDNDAPDLSDTFPFREWEHERDSGNLGNAVLVEPELRKHARWSKDATSIAAYQRQERFISDSNLAKTYQVLAVGERALAQGDQPEQTSTLVCWEPGLAPGQTVHVEEAVFGHDFDRIVESVEIRAIDPDDADGAAYLQSVVTLTDRRRPKGRHKGGGGSSSDSTNKVIRGRPGATIDTSPHPMVTFDDMDVEPPAASEGATVGTGTFLHIGRIEGKRTHAHYTGAVLDDYTDRWIAGTQALRPVQSSGDGSAPSWVRRPAWSGCSGLVNAFIGYIRREQWYKLVTDSPPANMAGIKMTLTGGAAGGVQGPSYAEVAPVEVVVMNTQPTAMGDGDLIATLMPGESRTVTVPAEFCPDTGDLWVGFRPSWSCDNEADTFGCAFCGFEWPFMSDQADYSADGVEYAGHSGRVSSYAPTVPKWMTYSASADPIGAIIVNDGGEAPWEGDNDGYDAGAEGDIDAWAITGGEWTLSSDSPSGHGIRVVGSREDDDQPAGPWSDVAWAHEYHFYLDAHGEVTDGGYRHLESTTTGEGEKAIGRVYFGDGYHAEGISVLGPTVEDYLAKALTLDELWKVRFCTRSGLYVRGKLWKASDHMPAAWDVQALLDETEDAQDRWTSWLRAGNDGTEQGVRVVRVRGFEGAVAGQRIVKEYIGRASGAEREFRTAHPFRVNTLRAYVNGIGVAPKSQDGADSRFMLDFWPTADSIMRATYIAD